MLLQHLEDAREIFASLKGSLVGVGMTAYPRMIPSYFSESYRIISARSTGDLHVLREKAEVFCLEEELGETLNEPNFQSARLLSHPLVRRYLKELPDPKYLYLYQSYPELEELAREEKWILLANPSTLRMETGSRSFFNSLVGRLNLNRVPGAILPIEGLWAHEYGYWAGNLGPGLAVQLPDVRQGGGRGTFFVSSESEFKRLRERLKEREWRGARLETVSLRRFVEGIPASVALCVTRKGVLTSRIQVQLIDLPYCRSMAESGVFCGHSWGGSPWPDSVKEEVLSQTMPIGEYLKDRGYRGILGIDLIIDREREKVYPLEINPRLTGAFPMLSQLHMGMGVIPMEVFHILEFLGIPYEADLRTWNEGTEGVVEGSHLLLFLMGGSSRVNRPFLKGGLYEMKGEGIVSYRRSAMDYQAIENDREFVIVDGPPAGDVGSADDLHRLCRLLFHHPLEGGGRDLNRALKAADWVYARILAEESHG